MARPRKPAEIATNVDEPPDIPLPPGDEEAEAEEIVPVEDMPEAWQLAYKRAELKGCTDKAARLYADAHHVEFESKE